MLQPEDESSTDLSMVSLERKQQEGSVHKCVKGFARSLMFQALRVQNLLIQRVTMVFSSCLVWHVFLNIKDSRVLPLIFAILRPCDSPTKAPEVPR